MQPEGRFQVAGKGSAIVEEHYILIIAGSQPVTWGRAKIMQGAAGHPWETNDYLGSRDPR